MNASLSEAERGSRRLRPAGDHLGTIRDQPEGRVSGNDCIPRDRGLVRVVVRNVLDQLLDAALEIGAEQVEIVRMRVVSALVEDAG